MGKLLESRPDEFARQLRSWGRTRAWIVGGPTSPQGLTASLPELEPVVGYLRSECRDYSDHEALLLGVGEETGALFGVFIHQTRRGQAQGGVRHWPYANLRDFLHDGLRLAQGMGRKCALAGLWWGGGKAIIARQPDDRYRDLGYRRTLYGEFGRFVSSLGGCYVTAEDVGTSPADMAEIHAHTRFATCIPRELGGSGNPSDMTAAGVVCAMRAALDARGMGPLAHKRIAMQGAGNVGTAMISRLLEAGVEDIVVTELSATRCADLQDQFAGRPVRVRRANADDVAILAEPCDVLVPNALGGVLGPKTIPSIQAWVVCGAANNQLLDEERDAAMLLARDITYVPDFVANRMGIVACSNEHAGNFVGDPQISRHLEMEAEDSIYQLTRRILAEAEAEKRSPVVVANRLADVLSQEPHPIWGHRAWSIIEALTSGGWERA